VPGVTATNTDSTNLHGVRQNGADQWGRGGLWGSHTGSPPCPGPQAGGYNILFAEGHVRWFLKWAKTKMTRHAKE
jgi:hypothetical protein